MVVEYSFYSLAAHIAGEISVMTDASAGCCSSTNWLKLFLIVRIRGSRYRSRVTSKSLASVGALLRAGALTDTSRSQYRRAWWQWTSSCKFAQYDVWLSELIVTANAEQVGAHAHYLKNFESNHKGQGNTYSMICSKLCAVRLFQ